jgi:hypothetical protein
MKVNIVTGTKITKIKRTIGAIKKMNPKGLILTPAVKILGSKNFERLEYRTRYKI